MMLRIDLRDIKNGCYKIKSRIVNKEYGSVLDEWKKMDMVDSFDPEDAEYLKRTCIPKRMIQYETIESNKLELDVRMRAHEIIYLHIEYRG